MSRGGVGLGRKDCYIQSLVHILLFTTPWTVACQAPLSSSISWSLLKFMFIESVMLSNHLILSPRYPFAFNLSQHHGLFQWVGSSCGQSIGASASASVLPMNIQDWFPLGLTGLISRSWSDAQESSSTKVQFSSVQSLSCVRLFATPWITARQASLSITNSWSLLKLMPIESVMPSNHLILCHPLLFLPSILPSIRVFSNESTLHMRWPKYWSFSFSISPSNEHPGLISFRMDWLDLLAVQGTLKHLLQHHSSKPSILWCSAFYTFWVSHDY